MQNCITAGMPGMQARSTNTSIRWMQANPLAVSILKENNSPAMFWGSLMSKNPPWSNSQLFFFWVVRVSGVLQLVSHTLGNMFHRQILKPRSCSSLSAILGVKIKSWRSRTSRFSAGRSYQLPQRLSIPSRTYIYICWWLLVNLTLANQPLMIIVILAKDTSS